MQLAIIGLQAATLFAFAACASRPEPTVFERLAYDAPCADRLGGVELDSREALWVDAGGSRWMIEHVDFDAPSGTWSLVQREGELVAVRPTRLTTRPRSEEHFRRLVDRWTRERHPLDREALQASVDQRRQAAADRRAGEPLPVLELPFLAAAALVMLPILAVDRLIDTVDGPDVEDDATLAWSGRLERARELPVRATRDQVRERLGDPEGRVSFGDVDRWWYAHASPERTSSSIVVAFDETGLLWLDPRAPALPRVEPGRGAPGNDVVAAMSVACGIAAMGELLNWWR